MLVLHPHRRFAGVIIIIITIILRMGDSGLDAEDDLPLTYQIGRQMLVDVLVPSSDPFRATHTAGAFATDSQINQEVWNLLIE